MTTNSGHIIFGREPDIDFDFSQVTLLTNRFQNPLVIIQSMEREMVKLERRLRPRLETDTPIGATRRLRESTESVIETQVSLLGVTEVTLIISQPARTGALTTTAQLLGISGIADFTPIAITQTPYRPFASLGRGPGRRPPYKNLISWVREKGFLPLGLKPYRYASLAFFIARKIGRDGSLKHRTRATPYAEITLDRSRDIIAIAGQNMNARIVAFVTDNVTKGIRRR